MQRRQLGPDGLTVPESGLGCWQLGGGWSNDWNDDIAQQTLRTENQHHDQQRERDQVTQLVGRRNADTVEEQRRPDHLLDGRHARRHIRLAVKNDRLTWTSERGSQTYVRCNDRMQVAGAG